MQNWRLELRREADQQGQPAPESRADNKHARPEEGWSFYRGRRIWVKNETGQDVLVYISKYNTIGELVSIGGGVGAGATEANIDAHMDLQRREGRVQIDKLEAGGDSVVFDVGKRESAAYVTAALASNKGMLVCKDRQVQTGFCLYLRATPFPDPTLAPQAGVAAGAAGQQG